MASCQLFQYVALTQAPLSLQHKQGILAYKVSSFLAAIMKVKEIQKR